MKKIRFSTVLLLIITFSLSGCQKEIKNIERPEKIVSKRNVVYDIDTYSKLADLWSEYYNEFPSEDAYANWMYAARYANWPDYKELLENGVNKYPANPTLLYLKAISIKDGPDNNESIRLLERAVELDPSFLDPWFGLVIDFMSIGDLKKTENALNTLLTEGAISEEIMDYNYNVISLLEKDAILITNGDNDTYPAWVLTKVVKYRPDVTIVNRSLLNSEWYPMHLIKNEGVPNFIKETELEIFRENILTKIKEGKDKMPEAGPFSDSLLAKIIIAAKENKRPTYLASTLFQTGIIKKHWKQGAKLGLVTFINSEQPYENLIRSQTKIWLTKFRTGGLSSWKLQYSKEFSAGKWLITNYGYSIKNLIEPVFHNSRENLLPLFNWYKSNILDLLPEDKVDEINEAWCNIEGIMEIRNWCESK